MQKNLFAYVLICCTATSLILFASSVVVAQEEAPVPTEAIEAIEEPGAGEPCPMPSAEATEGEDGAPCVVDPDQEPTIVQGERTERPDEINIEEQPWLIESVGLPENHPAFSRPKMIWAQSRLWAEAPEIEVEQWVTGAPDLEGKYVLVECWATWCPPCRRSLQLLNYYHEKYGDDLVVIAINETSLEDLEAMEGPTPLSDINFYMAIDTQRRFANALSVTGIPHAVIIEPQYGCVIWEGMPTLIGYELSGETIDRILEVGRKVKAAMEAAEEPEAETEAPASE